MEISAIRDGFTAKKSGRKSPFCCLIETTFRGVNGVNCLEKAPNHNSERYKNPPIA